MPAEEPRRKEASGWAAREAHRLYQNAGDWNAIAAALDAARAEGLEWAAELCQARAEACKNSAHQWDREPTSEASQAFVDKFLAKSDTASDLATAIRAAKEV